MAFWGGAETDGFLTSFSVFYNFYFYNKKNDTKNQDFGPIFFQVQIKT